MVKSRNPLVAAALGLPLTGLGHLYAGRPVRGGAIFLGLCLLGCLALVGTITIHAGPVVLLLPFVLLLGVRVWSVFDAAACARKAGGDYALRWFNRWYVYLAAWTPIALVGSPRSLEWVRAHVVQAFKVPAGSMRPTILIGDYLFVNKRVPPEVLARRGGIVVFDSVEEPDLKVIKRVIGVPGDTLEMRAGKLRLNGQLADERYVLPEAGGRKEDPVQRAKMKAWQELYLIGPTPGGYSPDLLDWGPLLVPPDSVFVLGDDRQRSYDSRYFGFVPLKNLRGRPEVIYFSQGADSAGAGAPRRIRWDRMGVRPS